MNALKKGKLALGSTKKKTFVTLSFRYKGVQGLSDLLKRKTCDDY